MDRQPCLLLPWVMEAPLAAQQVLLTALRGPDTDEHDGPAKDLCRVFRRLVVRDTETGRELEVGLDLGGLGGGFLRCVQTPVPALAVAVAARWDRYPPHFLCHMTKAAKAIASHHPNAEMRKNWADAIPHLESATRLAREAAHTTALRASAGEA